MPNGYPRETTSYDAGALLPRFNYGWDDYDRRLARYTIFDGYYHNMAYHTIVTYSSTLRFVERLYKHVRGVYNPVMRLVELYVGKAYPGTLDLRTADAGAIPIADADDNLRQAIIQLWKDSRWQQSKSLYPRNAARFGDSFIKIVDDIKREFVAMEPVDPRKVSRLETDLQGNIALIEFTYYVYHNGKQRLYKEVITPEKFATFEGDVPTAFYTDRGGTPIQEWDNPYGFVPVAHAKHRDIGLKFGAPSFMGTVHKINELNDLASIVNDGSRKQVEMPLVATGVKATDISYGIDNSNDADDPSDLPRKDTLRVLNLPGKDADLKAIAPTLNLADANVNIQNVLEEIERDLPELALHRIRSGGNLTAPGVTAAYDDAASRITEVLGNYDGTLVEAQQMAVAIGGYRNYEGYEGYTLDSRTNGDTDHRIKSRPIVNDILSRAERIDKTIAATSSPAAKILLEKELDYSEEEVDEIIKVVGEQSDLFALSRTAEDVATVSDAEAAITANDLVEAEAL
jgi:hypothetical protein